MFLTIFINKPIACKNLSASAPGIEMKKGNLSGISIVVFLALVLLFLILARLFIHIFFIMLANGAVIYISSIRIKSDIIKYNRIKTYVFAFIISTIIILLFWQSNIIWKLTALIALSACFVHAFILIEESVTTSMRG